MPTSVRTERGTSGRGGPEAGFALVELMLALAIVSLLAALALPAARTGLGAGVERVEVRRVASFLRAARNEALRTGQAANVVLDPDGRHLRAASGARIALPPGTAMRPQGLRGFEFRPDGRASGGALLFGRGATRLVVNPLTAAVELGWGAAP